MSIATDVLNEKLGYKRKQTQLKIDEANRIEDQILTLKEKEDRLRNEAEILTDECVLIDDLLREIRKAEGGDATIVPEIKDGDEDPALPLTAGWQEPHEARVIK